MTKKLNEAVTAFRATIAAAHARLTTISEADAARRASPKAWSPKEVVGHLIDSAGNNHQRFVRARFQDDLVFPGYDQDEWVRVQRYQDADWHTLIELWRTFNLHVAHVMSTTPDAELERPRAKHNLHLRAWQHVDESEAVTLEWFMLDYIGHCRHHLAQVFAR